MIERNIHDQAPELLMRDICEQPSCDPDSELAVTVNYNWLYERVRDAFESAKQAAQQEAEPNYAIEEDLEETQKALSIAETKIEEYEGFFTGEDGGDHGDDPRSIIKEYLDRHPQPAKPQEGEVSSEQGLEYRDCLDNGVLVLCSALGVDPERYDRDQSDLANYADCFEEVSQILADSGARWNDEEGAIEFRETSAQQEAEPVWSECPCGGGFEECPDPETNKPLCWDPPQPAKPAVPDESDLWKVLEAAVEAIDRKAAPHAFVSLAWEAGSAVIVKRRAALLAAPQPGEDE